MKKILLTAFSLVMMSSISYATEIDSEAKTPRTYFIEIKDLNHKVIYSTNLNNVTKKIQEKFIDVPFIDNCIMNNGIVEATKSSTQTGFKVSFLEDSDIATSLVINVSQISSKKKINTGECNIDELSLGKAIITQTLPFFNFEHKFHLKDSSGKNFPELYYLKVQGKKMTN